MEHSIGKAVCWNWHQFSWYHSRLHHCSIIASKYGRKPRFLVLSLLITLVLCWLEASAVASFWQIVVGESLFILVLDSLQILFQLIYLSARHHVFEVCHVLLSLTFLVAISNSFC